MAQTFTEDWDVTWYTSHERVRSIYIDATGVAVDATFTPETKAGSSRSFKLKEIRVKINTAPTSSENLTVTLDSNIGATHDITILSKDIVGLTTYNYLFDPNRIYGPGDKIVLAYTNTDTRNIGIQLIYCTGS
jgi:hypothetical protein